MKVLDEFKGLGNLVLFFWGKLIKFAAIPVKRKNWLSWR